MYAVHLIMDTQPHCPTCRDSLAATHATVVGDLTEKVEAIADLLDQLASILDDTAGSSQASEPS